MILEIITVPSGLSNPDLAEKILFEFHASEYPHIHIFWRIDLPGDAVTFRVYTNLAVPKD